MVYQYRYYKSRIAECSDRRQSKMLLLYLPSIQKYLGKPLLGKLYASLRF
jgi:hypothetical protein